MTRIQEFDRYIKGAQRKIAIAEYHLGELARCYDEVSRTSTPPVPIQAHFEGVLQAFISAGDRVAAGLNKSLRLGCSTTNLSSVIEAMEATGEHETLVSELKSWRFAALTRDAARARVGVVHYTYVKSGTGDGWVIERFGNLWNGDREFRAYCNALVEHLSALTSLLPLLRDEVVHG